MISLVGVVHLGVAIEVVGQRIAVKCREVVGLAKRVDRELLVHRVGIGRMTLRLTAPEIPVIQLWPEIA